MSAWQFLQRRMHLSISSLCVERVLPEMVFSLLAGSVWWRSNIAAFVPSNEIPHFWHFPPLYVMISSLFFRCGSRFLLAYVSWLYWRIFSLFFCLYWRSYSFRSSVLEMGMFCLLLFLCTVFCCFCMNISLRNFVAKCIFCDKVKYGEYRENN